MPVLGICETLSDINLECAGALNSAVLGPSDLDWSANPSSSVNCFDCFENLNEFE